LHCKKEWGEPIDHSELVKNSTLYDGHEFLCVPNEDPWWFKQLNEKELKEIKELPEKKIKKFINIMNKLRQSETKFSGARNWTGIEEVPVLNKSRLEIIDPMNIINML